MKKRFIRYNFNMVEIMLAVIVIALGIAGTFVLFPVGVNANKDATAENNIADVALYTEAVIRSRLLHSDSANQQGFRQAIVTNNFSVGVFEFTFQPHFGFVCHKYFCLRVCGIAIMIQTAR